MILLTPTNRENLKQTAKYSPWAFPKYSWSWWGQDRKTERPILTWSVGSWGPLRVGRINQRNFLGILVPKLSRQEWCSKLRHKEKKMLKMEKTIQDVWDNIKRSFVFVTGLAGEKLERGQKKYLETWPIFFSLIWWKIAKEPGISGKPKWGKCKESHIQT